MPKQQSRSSRWFEAVTAARVAIDAINEKASDLADALADLEAIRGEYEDWFDNLPENLQDSPVGIKLAEISQMDIDSAANDPLDDWQTTMNLIDEAEAADLPLGFGRD